MSPAVRTWLAVYPVATVIVAVIRPFIRDWLVPLRTLATSMLIVPLVVNISGSTIERVMKFARSAWTPEQPIMNQGE